MPTREALLTTFQDHFYTRGSDGALPPNVRGYTRPALDTLVQAYEGRRVPPYRFGEVLPPAMISKTVGLQAARRLGEGRYAFLLTLFDPTKPYATYGDRAGTLHRTQPPAGGSPAFSVHIVVASEPNGMNLVLLERCPGLSRTLCSNAMTAFLKHAWVPWTVGPRGRQAEYRLRFKLDLLPSRELIAAILEGRVFEMELIKVGVPEYFDPDVN